MLATEILTQDHRQALSLIELLENADGGTNENTGAFSQLEAALKLHMREEEEIYYPALSGFEEFEGIEEDLEAEHEMVRQMLAQMKELPTGSDEFQALLTEMKTALEKHMTEEEDDIFPESIEVLGADRIEMLGREIETLKAGGEMSRSVQL